MQRRFVLERLYFPDHLLHRSLHHVVGHCRLLDGKADAGILHARYLLEPLFDTHSTGGTRHPFYVEDHMGLGFCFNWRWL